MLGSIFRKCCFFEGGGWWGGGGFLFNFTRAIGANVLVALSDLRMIASRMVLIDLQQKNILISRPFQSERNRIKCNLLIHLTSTPPPPTKKGKYSHKENKVIKEI